MIASPTGAERSKILIVGVGGQGVLTAARFLGEAALLADLPVIVGQLHGMSQRGGSVECSVLIGPSLSSHIGNAEADVVLGLEPMEVLRSLPKLSDDTRVVVNLGTIVPFSLAMQGETYPPVEWILDEVRKVNQNVYPVDGTALVKETGEPRTLNVLMLGALAGLQMVPLDDEVLWTAVERRVPPRFVEANRKAFELGRRAVQERG